MQQNSSLLDLLLELQALDRVPRSGYSLRGIAAPESVAEHSFHLAFLVWSLAPEVPELDRERAVELALIHDLAEVRTGDLPRSASGYFPAGAKRSAEAAVANDLLAPLGERATSLFEEYQAKESLEARFVGACDRLQLLIKTRCYESWGATGLEEFWRNVDSDGGFAPIRRLLDELRRQHEAARRPGLSPELVGTES